MDIKNCTIAIEELLATEVISKGKLYNGTNSSAVRIIIEQMCIASCGGRWEFGTYFFIDNEINVYLKFEDINTGELVREKFSFTKIDVEDLVFKYIENDNISSMREEKVIKSKKIVKKEKKIVKEIEQISLF